jgi:Family of unknown function (DUF6152)
MQIHEVFAPGPSAIGKLVNTNYYPFSIDIVASGGRARMKRRITENSAMRSMPKANLKSSSWWAAMVLLLLSGSAVAHHSFAVFFDAERSVTVRGTVIDFQFRNPHGIIRMKVVDKDGTEQIWKAETNSPSILERRGWAKDSLKSGEIITIDGWPARDGSNYLRMRTVKRADGTPVGVPFGATEEQR